MQHEYSLPSENLYTAIMKEIDRSDLEEIGHRHQVWQFDDLHTAAIEALVAWLATADIPEDIKNLIHFIPLINQVHNEYFPDEKEELTQSDLDIAMGVLIPFTKKAA